MADLIFDSEPDECPEISDTTRRKLAVAVEDPAAANEIIDAVNANTLNLATFPTETFDRILIDNSCNTIADQNGNLVASGS